jgi:glycine cleavage system pyridoxal-binding protein P
VVVVVMMMMGCQGLRDIANRVHMYTALLRKGLAAAGHNVGTEEFFDTITIKLHSRMANADLVIAAAEAKRYRVVTWRAPDPCVRPRTLTIRSL